ncbi:MAG: T9SS type A sorting domain-containing protein [Bacteroidetes bacterium]|nr:T9SS type A sorting domain-containing protein [Bacteroidota bacterium]MBP9192242.1 T9SS type A sorting domain-containing protein [Ignavibacteria bacterium]
MKAFEDSSDLHLTDYIRCNDGGFLLYGFKLSTGLGGIGIITKTDSLGNVLWTKTSSGGTLDQGLLTSTGGFYFIGSRGLIKLDSLGNLIWCKSFLYSTINGAPLVFAMLANDGIVFGSYDNVFGNDDVQFTRLDSSGNVLWIKSFGSINNIDDEIYSGQLSPDSFIYAVGTHAGGGSLIKMDLNGNVVWYKGSTYSNSHIDILPSGELIVVSHSRNISGSDYAAIIGKFDSSGTAIHSFAVGLPNAYVYVYNLIPIDQSTYEIRGVIVDNIYGTRRYLAVVNDSGQVTSGRIFPGIFYPSSIFHHYSNSPNYFLTLHGDSVGKTKTLFCYDNLLDSFCIGEPFTLNTYPYVYNFGLPFSVVYRTETANYTNTVITFHQSVTTYDYCDFITGTSALENESVAVYPNPFVNNFNVRLSIEDDYLLDIYNINGEKICSENFRRECNVKSYSFEPGLYFYKIFKGYNLIKSGKVIKQ